MPYRPFKNQSKYRISLLALLLVVCLLYPDLLTAINHSQHSIHTKIINIRNSNGKFYAFVVLLFNENPHFVNLIQEDSISVEMMQKEGFHIISYRNYLRSIKEYKLRKLVSTMLSIYMNPEKYTDKQLESLAQNLSNRNLILRFSRDTKMQPPKIILDYCIYGKKKPVKIIHPLFNIKEVIYNIQPLIYYDEFSTSNSTFYFDMIYINPEEVQNDYIIAKKILAGESVKTMFFVGARLTNNITYCLKRAFKNSKSIKHEIWKMFEVHELTHKILNNHYHFFDQVTGEELSLVSTIYSNPYLGLSVMYSYLDYNVINPHRIAAMNFIRFIANRTGKLAIIENPSMIKHFSVKELVRLSREHFNSILKSMK